jgi:hypothetical protein
MGKHEIMAAQVSTGAWRAAMEKYLLLPHVSVGTNEA